MPLDNKKLFLAIKFAKINLDEFIVEKLDPKIFVPAPAQGVLALQTREDNIELIEALQFLHQKEVATKINIERKVPIVAFLDGQPCKGNSDDSQKNRGLLRRD